MTNRTYSEINQRIEKGDVVVLTAEEVKVLAEKDGVETVAKEVDVVTTGTFGPMCSSGAFLNFGHPSPPIKMGKVWLNNVPAYAGVAAVDAYIGATEHSEIEDEYGGAHVIEDLVSGKKVDLKARARGTDCYPRRQVDATIDIDSINEAFLFNPRNAYQNYAAATNSTAKTIFTYMGMLLPNLSNVNYSTSGELSPLLCDPKMRTIGLGTKIFLGGTQGFVAWNGTQFHTTRPTNDHDIPMAPAATLALIGDLKQMCPEYLKAAVYERYGISLFVGVGVPIPILDEEIAKAVCIRDSQIETHLQDYGAEGRPSLGVYNYEQLKSGRIEVDGKEITTGSMSSMYKAREISNKLKDWVAKGMFKLTEPVQGLPSNTSLQGLKPKEGTQ